MTTIAIIPENHGPSSTSYRAVAGNKEAVGRSAGEALDAMISQLNESASGTFLVVQHPRSDPYFTAAQQQRLEALMTRWRAARDNQTPLPPAEQAELEALVEAEVRAAGQRAAALVPGMSP